MALLVCVSASGQQRLTLDSCRRMALRTGGTMRQAEAKREQTEALQKAALWQMLPKVSVNGGYMWMEKSVNLLSENQKETLNDLGGNINTGIRNELHTQLDDVPGIGSSMADRIANALETSDLNGRLNEVGQSIVDGLETDTRNMGIAAATVTQPVYTGGKLTALYRTARLMNRMSGLELRQNELKTIAEVDEAYWQVVNVGSKRRLAEQYATLLDTLEHNVSLAVEAQVATGGDLAKVRVKQGEAHMQLMKAENGLALAKMLLAQRCGMALDADFEVDTDLESLQDSESSRLRDLRPADSGRWSVDDRVEMQMLGVLDSVAREGVRMASSALKPNIVATGGYMVSNPNVFDGFKNEWGGSFMAGVAVNIPIAHVGGIYSLKAAKAKRREVELQREDAKRLMELQVSKLRYELDLSYKKLEQSEVNLESARENLRYADESYRAGMCSSSDLMMAQTAWMEAESEVLETRIEIEMGRLYLSQAMGR